MGYVNLRFRGEMKTNVTVGVVSMYMVVRTMRLDPAT